MAKFKVACKWYIGFQNRMTKLGPSYYDCNERQSSCTRRKAQPRLGCPTCEFTIQYKGLIKELEEKLRKVKGGTRTGAKRWPAKLLIDRVIEVQGYANSRKKGSDPKWSVLTANLVSIYRNEVGKVRATKSFQANQEAEAAAAEARARNASRERE